jgi:serine/threonine protein phosphatase PrpC
MLARLRGMVQSIKPSEPESVEEVIPTWDIPEAVVESLSPPPMALPLDPIESTAQEAPEMPPADAPVPEAQPMIPFAPPLDLSIPTAAPVPAGASALPIAVAMPVPSPVEPAVHAICPACQSSTIAGQSYCCECGYFFPTEAMRTNSGSHKTSAPPLHGPRIKNRYEVVELLSERGGTARFRGLDYGLEEVGIRRPVHIVRTPIPRAEPAPAPENAPPGKSEAEDVLPTFDEPSSLDTAEHELPKPGSWPSVSWERGLLDSIHHPALPAIADSFIEDGFEYLVLEIPQGRFLWDAWDDPEVDAADRFGWLKQIAQVLQALHEANVLLEALRPDIVVVTANGEARLTDLSDLLPLPLPHDAPLRRSLYSAPELVSSGVVVDARADLYSFGAMLYALHVGRELTEMDFDRPGVPKPFIPRFPDIHPLFGRLISKTFQHDPALRFPTDEAVREDASGFTELIRTLETCRRTFDNVRLEIASWTTTGMVRTGNEDAFALLHAVESRQDDLEESALVLLADGMGGYEAGEIAAALAIQCLRRYLIQQEPFRALSGDTLFPIDPSPGGDAAPRALDVDECKRILKDALKDTNKHVYTASRSGLGRRGMGCTAEAVFVNGQHVIVGHVGDSRTYHLHEGRLIQLTRDHTLVSRLVELGMLTQEEAENHPRRNELQQAVGGQPDVEPGLYHGRMKPGDWVVVCSDGVTNHVTPLDLKEMLLGEALSAQMAARRLVNLVNIEGATDNATVVVIRAT